MATYSTKEDVYMKPVDIFDSVTTDSKSSISSANQSSVSETSLPKNTRKSAKSSKKDTSMKTYNTFLFEDTPEEIKDIKPKKATGKPKKERKAGVTRREKKSQHSPPEPEFNFVEDEQHDLFIESFEERQALRPIENLKNETNEARTSFQNHTPETRHLSKKKNYPSSHGEVAVDTPQSHVIPNLSINEGEDYAMNNSLHNITSRGRRHRHRRRIVNTPDSFTLSPLSKSIGKLTLRETHSSSTPKSANHNYQLEESGPSHDHTNDTDASINFRQDESGHCEFDDRLSQSEHVDKPCISFDLFENSAHSESLISKESLGESLSVTNAIEAEGKVLQLCCQSGPISFTDCIPERMMSDCVKIGEGVYGEVFKSVSNGKQIALKIIPIEGDMLFNDCPQKKYDEILPEIVIARELSDLAAGDLNRSSNFCQVNRVSCVKGVFPLPLLQQWDEYADRKKSENDRP
ncbi:hypothetical protein EGW08_012135, partial [Elysia chlorotica]